MIRKALLLLILTTPLMAQQQYSHGDPTNDEQYMLELINRARATPAEEGVRLMDTEDTRVQAAYSFFTIDKVKTKQAFTTYPSRPPLTFHPKLIQAARGHTADMVANNFQGHTGSNGSTLDQRFNAVGYPIMGQYGENVSGYSESVWYGHCGFNVDWGTQNQIDLGHRSNIMNFQGAVYTEIGIGITKTNGGLQSGTVGPYVITQDFGIQATKYVVGVVYMDANNNNFYDPGEGLSGVEVRPSSGAYYAVTSSSGGYAFPYTGTGSITVTASGGVLQNPITQNVTLSTGSVKVDFVPASSKPGAVTLIFPANGAKDVPPGELIFTWQSTFNSNEYQFQVASDNQFSPASIIKAEKLTAVATSADINGCDKTFYWRVAAINDAGQGPWSTNAFTTGGKLPSSPNTAAPKGNVTVDLNAFLRFQWSAVTDADMYYLILSSSANLSNPFFVDSTLTQTFADVSASVIPGGPFYWAVRAGNECGWGVRSSLADVVPTITSVQEFEPSAFSNNAVTVTIINLNGQVAGSVRYDDAAQMDIRDLVRGLSAGVYVVVATDGTTTQRMKVSTLD